jgi:hypothetical protein
MITQMMSRRITRASATFFVATALLSITPPSMLAASNALDGGVLVSSTTREVAKSIQTNPREKDTTASPQSLARSIQTNPREKDTTATFFGIA